MDVTSLLDIGQAGPFEVGMSVDEVVELVGRTSVELIATYPEGMFQPVIEISLPMATSQPALSVPILQWPCREIAVWGIQVFDPLFKTVDGIGVGSTLGELRRAFPTEVRVGREGGFATGTYREARSDIRFRSSTVVE